MEECSYRDTWAEISLDHIAYNLQQFRQYINPKTKIMAVVKADGYGHGAEKVAKTAIETGADYLAVAFLDEAIKLRKVGISSPILILGYTPVRSIREAILQNMTITVFDHKVLDEIIVQSSQLQKRTVIHIKVDTGMSRIGLSSADQTLSLARKGLAAPYIQLEGIFTHFANSDSEDPSYTYAQFHKFIEITSFLEKEGIHIPFRHCCNSAATLRFPEMHLDMVRVGIALYGLNPDASLKKHSIHLKQAMSFHTRIVAIKNVPSSQPVGYGCTWRLNRGDSIIATLSIGYADGLSRLLSNRGNVLLHGKRAPIRGRVCMDQTMIEITEIPNAKTGDMVTIFGENDTAFQSVDTIAELMGTIHYETVCLIGKRVPRVYLKEQKKCFARYFESATN
ncbi:alanine racemase [Ectobacillus polymachus]|uniref:alanine racemase n=1 Tax=Ectobacillus polymachus TaxID=1508806 RepID=UPI003A8522AD